MSTKPESHFSVDIAEQLGRVRDDIAKLTDLLSQHLSSAMAGDDANAKSAARGGAPSANGAAQPPGDAIQDAAAMLAKMIEERPVRSALVALAVGHFIGSSMR